MRSGVGLCVMALLCLHSSVFGQQADVPPGVLIFCDDPSVEKAVNSAVHNFNLKLTTGHKLALFQILTASKSENGAHSVYSLQFTTRRSDCLAGDSKHWTDCNYLPSEHKSPISCSATVHMSETDADTKEVNCLIESHVTPEKAPCLGCPEDIDENSEDIKVPLSVSISKYNFVSNAAHLFTLNRIGHATRQVVAGLRYRLSFDMIKTNCTKAEHKDLNDACIIDKDNMVFVNCNSTVDVAPWRLEPPEAQLDCGEGPLSSKIRRRPPGWSPLRRFDFDVSTTKPAPTTTPSKASAKQESSEEDTTAPKPTSATAAAEEVNNNPFHCPSKSWKPFHPLEPPMSGAPTKDTNEVPSPLPDTDTLSDMDLLA